MAEHSQPGLQYKTTQVHHVAFPEADLNFPQQALNQATAKPNEEPSFDLMAQLSDLQQRVLLYILPFTSMQDSY